MLIKLKLKNKNLLFIYVDVYAKKHVFMLNLKNKDV